MSGRARLTEAELLMIGRDVRQARADGAAWKVLCDRYGMSRAQLWRYAVRAAGAVITPARLVQPESVSETPSPVTPRGG